MRDFKFKRGAIFLFVLCLLFIFMSFASNYFDERYVSLQKWIPDIMLRKIEIANKYKNPKVLLIGGSNVYMGLSAEVIGKNINWPVVNLGISGTAYDLDLYLQYIRMIVKPGDLLVICMTQLFVQESEDSRVSNMIFRKLSNNLPAFQYENSKSSNHFLSLFPKYRPLFAYIFNPIDSIRVQDKTNEFGDAIEYKEIYEKSQHVDPIGADQMLLTIEATKRIEMFIGVMRSDGIGVIVLPPPLLIQASDFEKWSDKWLMIDEKLNIKKIFDSFPVSKIFLSDSSMFYSNFHPRDELKLIRNNLVIESVRVSINDHAK
jgi:hypothetical protein